MTRTIGAMSDTKPRRDTTARVSFLCAGGTITLIFSSMAKAYLCLRATMKLSVAKKHEDGLFYAYNHRHEAQRNDPARGAVAVVWRDIPSTVPGLHPPVTP